MSAMDVAASLGLDARAVERLAEAGELAARQVDGRWRFRAGDVANWAAVNLPAIPKGQLRSRRLAGADLFISLSLRPEAVAVPLDARTSTSVLLELVRLAYSTGQITNRDDLFGALCEREKQKSTALPGGVAIPHSSQVGRQVVSDWPVIAAGRVSSGIPFGDPCGELTDLFFLLCCPDYRSHLVCLGRLCRLLSEPGVLADLRDASGAIQFVDVLRQREEALCQAR